MKKILDHLEEWIITFLIGTATVITFLAVVHRYLSGFRIPGLQDWLLAMDVSWAQELTIYLFVWMAKFGAAYGVRTGIHVGVDVIANKLPPSWHKTIVLVALLGGALFTALIGTLGARFVWENGFHYFLFDKLGLPLGDIPEGPTSPDLELPTWIAYSAVPLGSYLMSFRFLQVIWGFVKTGELPHHDASHVAGMDEVLAEAEAAPLPISGGAK